MIMQRALAVLALVSAAACEPEDWDPAALGHGTVNIARRQLESGRRLYGDYCVGCHGERGDGQGPAAGFLDPKPRDFRTGRVKFAAVASGDAPRDDDYLRIISNGLHGTAMPSFRHLSESERAALVAYVRSFYADGGRDRPGAPVAFGRDPWAGREEQGITTGRRVYHEVGMCWSCHPAYAPRREIERYFTDASRPPPGLRPNIYEGELKESAWGAPIRAPDFLVDRVKNGFDVESLARVVASGVGGTAMPTWAGALDERQIYGLAHYVRSLVLLRGTDEARALDAELANQPPQQE